MKKLIPMLLVGLSLNLHAGDDSKAFRTQLGDRFDLRDFHDFILAVGSVPLGILKDEVGRWINQQGETK